MPSAILSQERCTCCAVRDYIVIKCEVKSSADQTFPGIDALDFLLSTLAAVLHSNHGYKRKVHMLQKALNRTKCIHQSIKQSNP